MIKHSPRGQAEHVIKVEGRFDYSFHSEFRSAYHAAAASTISFIVDLKPATHMDSASLGMLLLLKEHAEGLGASVHIHCNSDGDVRKVLDIARFERYFDIVDSANKKRVEEGE